MEFSFKKNGKLNFFHDFPFSLKMGLNVGIKFPFAMPKKQLKILGTVSA